LGGTGIFSHPFVMLLIPTQIFVQRPEFSVPAMTLSLEAGLKLLAVITTRPVVSRQQNIWLSYAAS
jgi:hypothetical protein